MLHMAFTSNIITCIIIFWFHVCIPAGAYGIPVLVIVSFVCTQLAELQTMSSLKDIVK